MEEQDTTKGFWIEGIQNPDAEGNCAGNFHAGYKGKIKVSLGKPKVSTGKFGRHTMMFKTVLPPHIHSTLLGRKIDRSRGGLNAETRMYDYRELPKTISADSLERLVVSFDRHVQDFLFVIEEEERPKEKMIFVNWKSSFYRDKTSNQNSAKIGRSMSMEFHFFVGYFNGASYYDVDHRGINTYSNSYERDVPNYNKIPWTQEREEFFNHVFDNFETLKNRLDEFFDTLTHKTVDSHISKFKMLT